MQENGDMMEFNAHLLEEMIEKRESLSSNIKKMVALLGPYLKDKRVDIDDRWKVFKQYGEYMPHDSCDATIHWEDGKEVSWYDHFYVERKQDVRLYELLEYSPGGGRKDEDMPGLRESILQCGLGSFTNDW